MNWLMLIAAALLVLGYPAFKHENDRYMRALHACMDQFVRNEYTLEQEVCADIHKRERASEAMRQSCLKAEQQNLQEPDMCARQRWVSESELVALYFRVAGSPVTLVILLSVLALGAMYFSVSFWTTDRQNKRMVETFQGYFQRPPQRPHHHRLLDYAEDQYAYD